MRSRVLVGSALVLAVVAFGSNRAAACDDDCDRCDGYAYYAAPTYYAAPVYYARPAYAYAPAVYYAAPAYSYYAPPVYYARPAYYAPPVYGYQYGRPYYLGRGGYVDATSKEPRKGYALPANPGTRGIAAFAAEHGPRAVKAQSPNLDPRKPAATVAAQKKPAGNVPAGSYGAQGKYVPTAYYGGPAGNIGLRR